MNFLFFLLIIALIPITTIASPLPKDPCGGLRQDCTPWMKQLHSDFLSANDLVTKSEAYRGKCYYHAHNYRNDHEHYAALLIETDEQGQVYFNGTFSFFAPSDRYNDWNLETARERISNPYRYPVVSYGDHSMADFSPDGGIWKFWLSQNRDTDEIYLISYWGFFQRGFCRFQPAN